MSSNHAERLAQLLRETRPAPLDLDLSSGLRGLDRVLGAGGLPAGQISEWVGGASSGKTGLLRILVGAARRRGVAVAWVDGPGALVAGDWVDLGAAAPLWVVRPPHADEAAFCAEVLLRTQSFGLVVLDGGPALPAAVGVRLQRLARQAAAALVRVRGPQEAASRPIARRIEIAPEPPPTPADPLEARAPLVWPVQVSRARGGEPEAARVHLVETCPDRLLAHAIAPDRPAGRTQAGTRYGIG
ncbi:MAG: hypothetical protein H6702_02890 [Myxococcales bacterium]|nr:hypothetical protein [Myxococcales bacterium]